MTDNHAMQKRMKSRQSFVASECNDLWSFNIFEVKLIEIYSKSMMLMIKVGFWTWKNIVKPVKSPGLCPNQPTHQAYYWTKIQGLIASWVMLTESHASFWDILSTAQTKHKFLNKNDKIQVHLMAFPVVTWAAMTPCASSEKSRRMQVSRF